MNRPLSTREAARLLGVEERQVRRWASAALGDEAKQGRRYAFGFRHLVVLRAARALAERGVPDARITRTLGRLAELLPGEQGLARVRVVADGRRVAVEDGGQRWDPVSGQLLLDLATDPMAAKVADLPERPAPPSTASDGEAAADEAFARALSLEDKDPPAALAAYRQALELEPGHVDAAVNLGRLLHQDGDADGAVAWYRRAAARAPDDAVVDFNLALALEDAEGPEAAVPHYERAIALDPAFADAHFNLAGLYESLGRERDAIRHYREVKRLRDG